MKKLDLYKNQQYLNQKPIINIASWIKSIITNLHNIVLAPIAATRDALAERLQSVRYYTRLVRYYITDH